MAYHGRYNSPKELIRDRSLSHCERMAMLESWRDDKEALLRASEEGMRGEVRLDYLDVIEKALTSLKGSQNA